MTPFEKSLDLYYKFLDHAYNPSPFADNYIAEGHHAKECAKLVCMEIIETGKIIAPKLFSQMTEGGKPVMMHGEHYWKEVIKEIDLIGTL